MSLKKNEPVRADGAAASQPAGAGGSRVPSGNPVPSAGPVPAQEGKSQGKLKHFNEHFFDTDDNNHLSGYEMFFIFIICALIGAAVEMVYCRVTNGYWENRSSLVYGPFGLAYSIGGLLLTLLLFRDTKKSFWKIFLKSFVWLTVAEYIMSLGMELVFHHVAWDYTNMPLNINGRVCLLYSTFWGILGCAWAKLIYPGFKKLIRRVPKKPAKILFWIVFIFFLYDCIISSEASLRFNNRTAGVPAKNSFERILDKQFPDWYMKEVYANSMSVDESGQISEETLSGEASHNPIIQVNSGSTTTAASTTAAASETGAASQTDTTVPASSSYSDTQTNQAAVISFAQWCLTPAGQSF